MGTSVNQFTRQSTVSVSLSRIQWILMLVMGIFIMLSFSPSSVASIRLDQRAVMKLVVEEATSQGVDPALALAVAQVESDFNPSVVSHKGARGVMQIMPKAAKEDFGVNPSLLFDARTNIRIGVTFIKQLHNRYGKIEYALSHYNGGSRVTGRDGRLRVIPVTQGYVDKVLAKAAHYRTTPPVMMASLSNYDKSYVKMQQRAEQLRALRNKNMRLASVMRTTVDPYLKQTDSGYHRVATNSAGYQNKRQQVLSWESIYRN